MEPKIGRLTPSALPRHVIVDSMDARAMQGSSHLAPQADPVTRSTSPRAPSRPFHFSLRPLVAASHRPATGVNCAKLLTTRDAWQGWRRHLLTLDVTISKRLRPGLATAIGAFCAPRNHGYQRTRDRISGRALIISQSSSGVLGKD